MHLILFILVLKYSSRLVWGSLSCYTCTKVHLPSNTPRNFDDPCWLNSQIKPLSQECKSPDEVCTLTVFFAKNSGSQRIIMQTCLKLTIDLPKVINYHCGFLRGPDHSNSAHTFFGSYFNASDIIGTRLCTCAAQNCISTPETLRDITTINRHAKTYNIANDQTLKTLENLYIRFREINLQTASWNNTPENEVSVKSSTDLELDLDGILQNSSIIENENDKPQTQTTSHNASALYWVLVSVSFIIGSVLILAMSLLFKRFFKSRSTEPSTTQVIPDIAISATSNTTESEVRHVIDGSPTTRSSISDIESYEIDENQFLIDETNILGTGEFGIVCLGKVVLQGNMIDVAVKMTRQQQQSESSDLAGLLSEIESLCYLGSHENIVRLLGCYTKATQSGRVLAFLEFCHNGSLKRYLRRHQPPISVTQLDYQLSNDLLKWATEIARGMEFVASKKLVHADLATRNVLLSGDKTAKIADFGLSKRLRNSSSYVKRFEKTLPWRWMAPESIKKYKFTEKSDIWAFGVLLWELYTFADVPYGGMAWLPDFVTRLEEGLRLSQPKYAQLDIYELMQRCWNINPNERPRFLDIRKILDGGRSSHISYRSLHGLE